MNRIECFQQQRLDLGLTHALRSARHRERLARRRLAGVRTLPRGTSILGTANRRPPDRGIGGRSHRHPSRRALP